MTYDPRIAEQERIAATFEARDKRTPESPLVQDYFDRSRWQKLATLIGQDLGERLQILDVGCGSGDWLAALCEHGVSPDGLFGIDLSSRRVARAKERFPAAQITQGCASKLPYDDASFDGIVLSLVLSSIHDPIVIKRAISEIWRVLVPGGWLLIHEIRRRGLGGDARPFKPRHLREHLPMESRDFPFLTLTVLPPLVRLFAPWAMGVIHGLDRFSVLHGHWMARINKERK